MRKNIFFDFGRTLVKHPEDEVGLEIVKRAGAGNDEDAKFVRDVVFSVGRFVNDLDEGILTFEEYLEKVADTVPDRLKECTKKTAMYDIYELPMIEGMEELIKKLKKDGFNLYITSNMNVRQSAQMRTHKIAKYFNGMIFSAEIKTRKPQRAFFEAAFKEFNVKPEECIFIDDLADNVRGGEACGILSFLFKGNAHEAEKFIYNNFN